MFVSRRRFLGMSALFGTLLRWPRAKAVPPPAGVPILQGMTDENSTQFAIVVPAGEGYTTALAPAVPFTVSTEGRAGTKFNVLKMHVNGPLLGRNFKLQVFNGKGEMVDVREFSGLDLSPRKVRIALVSCAMDHLHRRDIWKQFSKQKPDMVFFLGDSVYCDRKSMSETVPLADPAMMWDRYVETRQKVDFYFQKRLTPVLATWDDHDFGGNNLGANNPYVNEAKYIFEAFFAQDPRPALEGGPGVARRFKAFGGDFVFLDGRSFRGDNKTPGESLLGTQQEVWLATKLARSSTWLINGSVFFGAYGDFESFEGDYPAKFQELLDVVKSKGTLAAFISGDVHFSEVMDIEPAKLGYSTFELVSSSVHSITFPSHHDRFQNPRRRLADSPHNFLIFEGTFGEDLMGGTVTCWGSSYDLFSGEVSARR
jgi:hypothetical protein